ncbi:MAG TPA: Crp/Fnr family transcriptional regulator [Dehalococcoidia bacterium]|nr:Crp/Fnr family transcriptional regulator [Dehalococcoidia bacterium]
MTDPVPRAIATILNATPLFSALDAAGRRDLLAAAEFHEVAPRTKLFEEGAACDGLWVMAAGAAKLYLTGATGQIHITSLVGPASALDLVAALDGERFGVTAETIAPAQVVQIPRSTFLNAVARNATMLHVAVDQLCAELRRRDVALAIGGLKDSRQRIACTLIRWSKQHGIVNGDAGGPVIPYPLTRQDLAASVGVTLETAIRQLAPLERTRIIRTSRRGLEILNGEALADVASCDECTFPCALFD